MEMHRILLCNFLLVLLSIFSIHAVNSSSSPDSLETTTTESTESTSLPSPLTLSEKVVELQLEVSILKENVKQLQSFQDAATDRMNNIEKNQPKLAGMNRNINWGLNNTTPEPKATTTTTKSPIAEECPSPSSISPCTCNPNALRCQGSLVTQETINTLMKEFRLTNEMDDGRRLYTHKEIWISNTTITELDLTPLLKSRWAQVAINNNDHLIKIHALTNSSSAKIDTEILLVQNNGQLDDEGLSNFFNFFTSSLSILHLEDNKISGFLLVGESEKSSPLAQFKELSQLYLNGNPIKRLENGSFFSLNRLNVVSLHHLNSNNNSNLTEHGLYIGENAFSLKNLSPRYRSPQSRTIDLHSNGLNEDSFHENHGLDLYKGRTYLNLEDNQFVYISREKFEKFLEANPSNTISFYNNLHIVCDQRMKWLKEKKDDYEYRVLDVHCKNDENNTIFTTQLV